MSISSFVEVTLFRSFLTSSLFGSAGLDSRAAAPIVWFRTSPFAAYWNFFVFSVRFVSKGVELSASSVS